ncbi:hypothetical protein JHL18_18650 [Clostridium sp. YIM B02505]|uniref:DUF4878 domain-containing protein n=1 Tax=Clostridium yunnanense TaxID=2800325 RepID=A0ABS1ETN2_9CLOT|nr:hypothetical protein [Clostridium yunnanense]MBK1812643.1 hypothetical protein [Clostridium yunnanense]
MNLYKRLRDNKRIVSILIVVAIFAVGYPVVKNSEKETLEYKTEEFFNNIIEEKYEAAFMFLDYGEVGKETSFALNEDNKRGNWIKNLKRQRASGVRIERCKEVKVDNVDYPRGTVKLIVSKNGVQEEYIVNIKYTRNKNSYKIRNINKIDDEIQQTICGRINGS